MEIQGAKASGCGPEGFAQVVDLTLLANCRSGPTSFPKARNSTTLTTLRSVRQLQIGNDLVGARTGDVSNVTFRLDTTRNEIHAGITKAASVVTESLP